MSNTEVRTDCKTSSASKALFSSKVVVAEYCSRSQSEVVPAAIFIENDKITQVLVVSPDQDYDSLRLKHPSYEWENLTPWVVSPGLIDINVCFNSDYCDCPDSCDSASSACLTSSSPAVWEGYETGTRAAAAAGVTTVIETPALLPTSMSGPVQVLHKSASLAEASLYCDVGFLANVFPSNLDAVSDMSQLGVFGFKAYLLPPAGQMEFFTEDTLSDLQMHVAEVGKPLFVHPELTTERFLYMSSPFRTEQLEERSHLPEPPTNFFAAAFPEELIPSSAEASPAAAPSGENVGDELHRIYSQQHNNHESLVEAELLSYAHSGPTIYKPALHNISNSPHKTSHFELKISPVRNSSPVRPTPKESLHPPPKESLHPPLKESLRPPPISIVKPEVDREHREYKHVLANSSKHWEVSAVRTVTQAVQGRVHFSNLSSANAVIALSKLKKDQPDLQVTCETSPFYLHFSEQNIRNGDTRFKVTPPIREESNRTSLLRVLKLGFVDTVASYHRPIKRSLKCLQTGNFKRAVSGISSLSYCLPALWSAFQDDPQRGPVHMAKLTSSGPAAIVGLDSKGSLCPGKDADIVVWDPDQLADHAYSSTLSPFSGEELSGCVMRTYLRGQLVFAQNTFRACGQVLLANPRSN